MDGHLPKSVAIIMDGNGRWAQARGYGRTRGHREGAKRVDEIVTECCELGIPYLTLYAFSTENWGRPPYEVSMLMRLLVQHLRTMDKKLIRNRVRLLAQGSLERLPYFARVELKRVMRTTAIPEPKCHLNLSLSYGARQELVDAARRLAEKVRDGELDPEQITEGMLRDHLYQPMVPDPDLVIRTAGEFRMSNFLLWQIAYSELYVTDTVWPDFGVEAFHQALDAFGRRERRYGLTSQQQCLGPVYARAGFVRSADSTARTPLEL